MSQISELAAIKGRSHEIRRPNFSKNLNDDS